MKNQVAIVSIAAVILLGGCTSSIAEATPPTELTASTVAEATSAPSPTPSAVAEMTKQEAAQQYLDLVRPVNDLLDETSKPWDDAFDANDWQQMSALAARDLEAERAFSDSVVAASWPADLVPLIDEMISQGATDIAWYSGLVNASSEDEFWTAYGTGGSFDRSAAEEIRLRLGLESLS